MKSRDARECVSSAYGPQKSKSPCFREPSSQRRFRIVLSCQTTALARPTNGLS
jgi:hypothetical protein